MSERRYKIPFPVRVYPGLTWRAWLTPPPIGSRTLEKDREATADLTPLDGYEGFEAGSGPLVLALHGWGGRAAQMAPVARRLAAEGYRVVAPELPSRAGAPITDIKKVAAVVTGMIDRLGFPEVVIAHSFAAVVMRVVFVDRGPRLAVMFGPALDWMDAVDTFSERLRLFPWAKRGLVRRLERFDPALTPRMRGLPVDHMPDTDLLLIHAPDDPDALFSRSAELAALRPASILVAEGLGHSRILGDPAILDRVAEVVGARV